MLSGLVIPVRIWDSWILYKCEDVRADTLELALRVLAPDFELAFALCLYLMLYFFHDVSEDVKTLVYVFARYDERRKEPDDVCPVASPPW